MPSSTSCVVRVVHMFSAALLLGMEAV